MFLNSTEGFRKHYLIIALLVFILGVVLMFGMKASTLSGVQLETHQGVVSELIYGIQEHIDHDPADTNLRFLPTRKEYLAHFLLDGKPVDAKFQMPFKLANGDRIVVAGYAKQQSFNVLALNNQTEKVIQSNHWQMALVAGLVFAILSLMILLGLLNSDSMVFPQILLGIFVLIGLFIAHHGLLIKEARSLL